MKKYKVRFTLMPSPFKINFYLDFKHRHILWRKNKKFTRIHVVDVEYIAEYCKRIQTFNL